jgi:hypothetical protein
MAHVILDFAPGSHGHFLEYVLNRYVFGVKEVPGSIFQSSGACHPINMDAGYQAAKQVHRGHYSSFDNAYSNTADSVIFIRHDPALDFVLLTNIYFRCHPNSVNANDFNIKETTALHKQLMGQNLSPPAMKNNWYTKLQERHFDMAEKKQPTALPRHEFHYEDFFDLEKFLLAIKRTSKFLNFTFKFDPSLVELWKEFIIQNQGWRDYELGRRLFNHAVAGDDVVIPNDWKIQAFLNHLVSQTFDLYDSPELFGTGNYVPNTKILANIIQKHVDEFDSRW